MPTIALPRVPTLPVQSHSEATGDAREDLRPASRGLRGVALGIVLGAGLWVVILTLFGVIKL